MFGYCAPSPGEDEHHLALATERLGLVVDAGGGLDPGAVGLGQLLDRLPQLLTEVLHRGADDGQSLRSRRAPEFAAEREREIRQRKLR